MGGGDLNAKKAWHPNTLKNQERVWKAEQAAAEEKKRIVELERERQLERERADLNKLARNNLGISGPGNDDRLHWMYEKPDKKVQQEEYLLGKAIDKNHDQAGKSQADEIPAVSRRVIGSSMLSISGDTQVDLARKMREDPLLLVKERERAARAALLNNPVQRARLTELLRKEQENKKESKSKKEKKKDKSLDIKLAEKLQAITGTKKVDLAMLLASGDSSSESSDEEPKKKKKKKAKKKSKSKKYSEQDSESEEERTSKKQSKNESKKRKCDDSDSEEEKKKKNHNKKASRKHNHDTKTRVDESEDDVTARKKKKRKNKKESNKNRTDGYSSDDQKDYRKSKSECEFRDRDKGDRYSEGHKFKSKNNHYSKDENESKRNKYSKSERQSNDAQYCSNQHVSNDDKNSRYVTRMKDDDSNLGNRREVSYVDDRHSSRNHKEKDKGQSYRKNISTTDKEYRGYKRSGISEDEKAAKLAEMAAAGLEREKQRERRVAQQLAEKEKADQPSFSHTRSGNVINQLPDSLESRIHSNRHYIQRDQRHMNEHFARR